MVNFFSLCPDKWVWSRLKVKGSVSPSLAAHGCAVLGARLYLFGGLTPNGSASDQLYCLHTGKCVVMTAIPKYGVIQTFAHDCMTLYF